MVGGGISIQVVPLTEVTVKVDRKGRIVIPSNIRRRFNIKNLVKIIVKEGEITLKPVEDPLKTLEKLVVKGTTDVEKDIQRLRRVAERELQKEG
ncbi:AbrB/MazE/SpoVT family DNA-binding domain-containing protein [Candidatus Bathyarchaeota archaeon]|nr:MAG: AbrB/MazE/SpoVT family DNA-binding domain-containing protein [Candidatus Bathyarchaeota archaeon]